MQVGNSHFRKVMQSRGKKQANTTTRRRMWRKARHSKIFFHSRLTEEKWTCGGCRVIVRRNDMNEGRIEESLTDTSHNHKKRIQKHEQFQCCPLKKRTC